MPEINEETRKLAEEFQILQQQLQAVMMQKENIKIQDLEIDRALEELDETKEKTAFKITGNVMINKPIEELKNDLKENKETIKIRINSFDKNETRLNDRLKELQEQLQAAIK